MASSNNEDGDPDSTSSSRMKRGLSITGMLRDSLSLLVPSFVLDATTPKRRRIQEETSDRSSSERNHDDGREPGHPVYCNISSIQPAHSSTPTMSDSLNNRQAESSVLPLYPCLNDFRDNISEAQRENLSETPVTDKKASRISSIIERPLDIHQPSQSNSRSEALFTSAKRSRLNDSQPPSSSLSCWTHTSGSSSSGSLLGEAYHQSSFYPGRITFGGASNYRREAIKTRLNTGRRSQATVVPLRLNAVMSQRTPSSTDGLTSTSDGGGPVLSASTRRILRAMRRGTEATDGGVTGDSSASAYSIHHHRHALWASCVRRRGRGTSISDTPPIMGLSRLPQTDNDTRKILLATSWPRDTIGVPTTSNSTGAGTRQDNRICRIDSQERTSDIGSQIKNALGVISSHYAFSSPANRSQPSTRPPSNASGADIGRSNFTFQSPPSRSASSNALTDLVSNPSSTSVSHVTDALMQRSCVDSQCSRITTTTQNVPIANSLPVQSKIYPATQSKLSPVLFSGNRTLPDLHPPVEAFSLSIPTTSSSLSATKRALPQDSWRCEACLAENAFLLTVCRICQRGPSASVVNSQREWYSQPNTITNSNISETKLSESSSSSSKDSKTNELIKSGVNLLGHNVSEMSSGSTKTISKKWRCDTCLVENEENMNACVCCQSSKPLPQNVKFTDTNVIKSLKQQSEGKWRCETCFVENKDSENTCICCQSCKQKPDSQLPKDPSNLASKSDNKWRCDDCLVENESSKDKCVCCEAKKPTMTGKASVVKAPVTKTGISNSSWRCDTCLVENKFSSDKCVCCETLRKSESVGNVTGGQSVIQSGGLLATWKTDTSSKFTFGSFSSKNNNVGSDQKEASNKTEVNAVTNNDSEGIKFGGKTLDGGTTHRFKFDSHDAGLVKDGPINTAGNKIISDENQINKDAKPIGGKIVFGNLNTSTEPQQKPQKDGFQFGRFTFTSTTTKPIEGSSNTFKFGNSSFGTGDKNGCLNSSMKFGYEESVNPKLPKIGSSSEGNTDRVGVTALAMSTNNSEGKLGITNMCSNISKPTSQGQPILFGNEKVIPFNESNDQSADGLINNTNRQVDSQLPTIINIHNSNEIDFKQGKVAADSKLNKDTKSEDSGGKIQFGVFNTSSSFKFPAVNVAPTQSNAIFGNSATNSVIGNKTTETNCPLIKQSEETGVKSNEVINKIDESSKISDNSTAVSNGLMTLQGNKPDLKPSMFSTNPTTIESLFPSSAPKSLFKGQSEVALFNTSAVPSTFKSNETSLFDSVESNKQKRLTSSISSPTLNTLPFANSDSMLPAVPEMNKAASVSANFSFNKTMDNNTAILPDGKSGLINDFQSADKSVVNNSNTFVFGGNSVKQANIFGSQAPNPDGSNPTASNTFSGPFANTSNTGVTNTGFGNATTTSGLFGNGSHTNVPILFGNNAKPSQAPVFGSGSTQPFVFGSSVGSGLNNPGSHTAQTVPVPQTFQFGQQAASNPPFVFGSANQSNAPIGSNNPMAPAANPFSSQPAVGNNSGTRPFKKAHRRLRK